jgi:microcystin-dependent protein
MPGHTHTLFANSAAGTTNNPAGNMLAGGAGTIQIYTAGATAPVAMNAAALTTSGGSAPHNNLAPVQCVNYIIALYGIYPSRP